MAVNGVSAGAAGALGQGFEPPAGASDDEVTKLAAERMPSIILVNAKTGAKYRNTNIADPNNLISEWMSKMKQQGNDADPAANDTDNGVQ